MRKFKFLKNFWEYILHTFSTWKKINWPLLNNMHAFTYIYYQNSLSGLLLWNHCTELLCRYMWSFRNKINSFSVQLLWKLFLQILQIRVGQSWWYQKTWKKWPYAVFIHPWTCAYKLLICMPIFSQSWQNLVCSISVAEEKHKIHALGHYPHPIPTLRLYTYWIKMVKIDVWRAFLLLIVMETYAYVGLQMTFSMTQKWNH